MTQAKILVPEQAPFSSSRSPGSHYRADLTPEERIQMLDASVERNRHIPALPESAFDRESLYADPEEESEPTLFTHVAANRLLTTTTERNVIRG